MRKLCTMREALASPDLFGSPTMLGDPSWAAWRALLIAIVGEELTAEERELFLLLTGREREPGEPVKQFWAAVGRRGGKTRAMAVLAAFLAALVDNRGSLAPGQKGKLPVMAATKLQAREAFGYLRGIFNDVPRLRKRKNGETDDTISLDTQVDIEVRAADFRGLRGFASVGVICDEIAFWRSDDSANPDTEILRALRPSLADTGGPLIAISSPYARRGELWKTYSKHYGPNGNPLILVARAPTEVIRPTFPKEELAAAYEEDPANAAAEYGAEFRTDIEAFISQDAVTAAVRKGCFEISHDLRRQYVAFVDPAGGSGTDSMTLAIAHSEEVPGRSELVAVLDLVREIRPPFSPDAATEEMAETLKAYGLTTVTGDRYAGEWPRERFRAHGVSYECSERDRSKIYAELLPLLNSGRVDLLDNQRLVAQLCALERRPSRGGRDSIDHPRGAHDDVINAAAGALVIAGGKLSALQIWERFAED